jgi:hypothetical protein
LLLIIAQFARFRGNSNRTWLPDGFLFHGNGTRAAGRALDSVAELANVYLQLGDGTAQGIAVHAQLARRAALIALIFLEHGQDEAFLELADAFGIENVASIHLQNECFQLIFHVAVLSLLSLFNFYE